MLTLSPDANSLSPETYRFLKFCGAGKVMEIVKYSQVLVFSVLFVKFERRALLLDIFRR